MSISREERSRREQKRAEQMAEAQRLANHWNLEHGHEVKPLGFKPAPGMYQGFNHEQRRDGTAKRAILEMAERRRRWAKT